jgi:hypothetical protein
VPRVFFAVPVLPELMLAIVDVTVQSTIVQLPEYRASSVLLKLVGMKAEIFVVENFQSEASH